MLHAAMILDLGGMFKGLLFVTYFGWYPGVVVSSTRHTWFDLICVGEGVPCIP